jgi:hypothetical protein
VSRLRDLLRAFDQQAIDKQAEKLRAVTALNRTLRQEVRELRDAVARVTELTSALQVRTEQLATLRREDASAGARLARLSPLFDAEGIARHVRSAVARAVSMEEPFPYLVIPELLSPEAAAALLDAIPPRILFDDRSGGREIPVPPRLAPVASIVAWEFLFSAIVIPVLAPALIERFQLPGAPLVSGGRLVLHTGDRPVRRATLERAARITTIVPLGQADEGDAIAVRLYRPDAQGESQPARSIRLAPNVAVALRHAPGAYDVAIPAESAARTERYAWQVDIGVDAAPAPPPAEGVPTA